MSTNNVPELIHLLTEKDWLQLIVTRPGDAGSNMLKAT